MTLDDGVVQIYQLKNTAAKGNKPKYQLIEICRDYFGIKTAGSTRFFAAQKANTRIDMLIRTNRLETIGTAGLYAIIFGEQYRVVQNQLVVNEDGLKMSDLSLERLEELYDVG